MSDLSPIDERSEPKAFGEALSERYLAYALSTIMSRSLPDVRDGLKPVHRRLLYAMRLLKLDPDAGYKKCARVVGDVIGKYHPHGDQAVYDALVRLAQDFAVRYRLIDGQGNFGNIDGDNAAAMRYTEARLTDVARAMMDGLDEDCVPFRETYDGEEKEPIVLPAGFPNLLANGASGIAVGMATSIPPHNVAEISEALMIVIDWKTGRRQQLSTAQLVNRMPGPDFPTGGILVEDRDSIVEAYETGRGGFRLRAAWEKQETGRGMYEIVITEIPYHVQKSKLIERIAEIITEKKLPLLADVRDESAEDIRIVLEPRSRTVDANLLMESLFKLTDLEVRIPLNMNVLDARGVPRVMSLRDVLDAYLDHRLEVLVKRTEYRLGRIEHRLEVLSGYLAAFVNLDEVIRIIREEDEPKPALMQAFDLTEIQAEAILNMRLRSLRKLEEHEIRKEHDRLSTERAELKALLKSPEAQWQEVGEDIQQVARDFGAKGTDGARKTRFEDAPQVDFVPAEAMIEKEPITVVCSKLGWVRALKGHVPDGDDIKYKEGDGEYFRFHAHTTDKILAFATDGRFYTIGADTLPGGRGHGEPIRMIVDLGAEEDIAGLMVWKEDMRILVASSAGKGFCVSGDNVLAQTRQGRQVMSVSGNAHAKLARPIAPEHDHLAVMGGEEKLLIFPLADLPQRARGQGVVLQKYKKGTLWDAKPFTLAEGLTWTMGGEGGRTRTETDLDMWLGKRGQVGKKIMKGFPNRKTFD